METKTMDNNRVTPEQMRILKQYVTYTGEKTKGPWTCNKCHLRNWGRPNRIVAHLLWIKGKGIRPCPGMKGTAEREELARRLGRNSQPEEIANPIDEAYRGQALLEDNGDSVEETNAECSEMINTIHHEQSSQPDSTQHFFPQGGMDERMDDPIYTPSQVVFDHMNDEDVHPSRDGPTINPSRAASSMDIEGQQQRQPEEEYDSLNNLGNIENTSSRAGSSEICLNREHHLNVSDMDIAGREGGASPDVRKRMQNAVSQEKENKKRKCASGSGTSGSDPTEAEMPQLGASNSCSALCASISVSEGNMWSSQNLEKSDGGTDLQPENLEQNSAISVSDLIRTPPETPGASMMVPPELCTLPSQDQQRAYVPNTDDDGVQGTNAVGPEIINAILRGQSSQPDSIRVSSLQGDMDMGMGDLTATVTPPPPQVGFDQMNDQHTHPLQHGVGIDISTLGNGCGLGMASSPVVDDETPPPCPPGFDSDLWEFYVGIDRSRHGNFPLYKECMVPTDEEDRKERLACLESACSKVRDDRSNSPLKYMILCQKFHSGIASVYLRKKLHLIREIEAEIRGETGQGVQMLERKRNNEIHRWLRYAERIKTDADDLDCEIEEAKSPEEIESLLKRMEELTKVADILIETGKTLLNPIVPKDLLSWNPNARSCGSRLQNHMIPGQFPQQV